MTTRAKPDIQPRLRRALRDAISERCETHTGRDCAACETLFVELVAELDRAAVRIKAARS